MLDITNNPVGLQVPSGQGTDQSGAQNLNLNSAHSEPSQAQPNPHADHPQPPTPPIKFEDSKIESMSSNPDGMNTFTKMFLIATVIFVVGHLAFFLYYLANNSTIKTKTDELATVTTKLTALKTVEQDAETLIAANQGLTQYYNDRIDRKKLWTELDSRLLKKAQITSFTIDEKGTFNMSGQTDSLTNLAKTMVSYRDSTSFKNTKLTGTSFSIDDKRAIKVTFSLSGQVDLNNVRVAQ